jgi:cytidylate kinase
MAIITIYQGASGSGEELADQVAQALGYGCVSREVLIQASLRYGIPEAKLSEITERESHWWQRFLQDLKPYRLALQAAFCEIAETAQGIVYHGHLGHELVPHLPHVIKILLTAPVEVRVKQVEQRLQLNQLAARRYVEEVDKARTRRLKALFNADWRDPSRYDLLVNMGRMSVASAKHLIVETSRLPEYQMTETSKQAFSDFSLASRVRADLALSHQLAGAMIDVTALDGVVSVSGIVPRWVDQGGIIERVRRVSGVNEVNADQSAPLDMSFGT